MASGWVSIHRQVFENPIAAKPAYLAIWIYILSHANFADGSAIINGEKIPLKRGQFVGSLQRLSKQFDLSISTVKKIVDYLERDGMVNTKRTRHYTIFHVVNYDRFQDSEHQKNTERSQRETTNKNNKGNNSPTESKPRKPKPNTKDHVEIPDPPEWIDPNLWEGLMANRKAKKAANSPQAIQLIINNLTRWKAKGHDIDQILEYSVTGGYPTVYEPKPSRTHAPDQRSPLTRASDAIGESIERSKSNYTEPANIPF